MTSRGKRHLVEVAGVEPASSTPLRQRNYSNHCFAAAVLTMPATSALRFQKHEDVSVFNQGEGAEAHDRGLITLLMRELTPVLTMRSTIARRLWMVLSPRLEKQLIRAPKIPSSKAFAACAGHLSASNTFIAATVIALIRTTIFRC